MKRIRRTFSAEFEKQTALDAIWEQMTLSELAQKYGIQPIKCRVEKTMSQQYFNSFSSSVDDNTAQAKKELQKLYLEHQLAKG